MENNAKGEELFNKGHSLIKYQEKNKGQYALKNHTVEKNSTCLL